MSLLDNAKAKLDEATEKASSKTDIAKQRVEGEVDKAKGDKMKGEAKVQISKLRDKLNK